MQMYQHTVVKLLICRCTSTLWCDCWYAGVPAQCGVTVDMQVYQHNVLWLCFMYRCTSTMWCDCVLCTGVPAPCGVTVFYVQVYQHHVVWLCFMYRCTSTMWCGCFMYRCTSTMWCDCFMYRCTSTVWCDCVLCTGVPAQCGVTAFYVQVYQHSVVWLCFMYRCTSTVWCDCVLCTGVPAQCLRQGLSVPLLQESPDGDGSGLQHYGAGVLHVHFQRLHGRVSQHAWQSPDRERVLHVRVRVSMCVRVLTEIEWSM